MPQMNLEHLTLADYKSPSNSVVRASVRKVVAWIRIGYMLNKFVYVKGHCQAVVASLEKVEIQGVSTLQTYNESRRIMRLQII